MNKIIITLIMLLASISFSQVNTMYHDGTDCNCDSINESTPDVISKLSNYKNAMEQQEDAQYQLLKLFGKANVKLNSDGTYSLNLDNTKVAENKDALKDAGFKVYSFRKAKQNAIVKLKQGAINAAYAAWPQWGHYTDRGFKIKESAMRTSLNKYNTDKKTNIEWNSIKEAVKEKIKKHIGVRSVTMINKEEYDELIKLKNADVPLSKDQLKWLAVYESTYLLN